MIIYLFINMSYPRRFLWRRTLKYLRVRSFYHLKQKWVYHDRCWFILLNREVKFIRKMERYWKTFQSIENLSRSIGHVYFILFLLNFKIFESFVILHIIIYHVNSIHYNWLISMMKFTYVCVLIFVINVTLTVSNLITS
jgi:hypothetical protein